MSDSGTQMDGEEVRPCPDELVKLEQERNKFEAEMNEKDNEISKCYVCGVCVCVVITSY